MSDATLYGIPVSYLAYNKSQIMQAIKTAISTLEPDEIDFRETLVHSFLHLAQFIPDDQVDIVRRGQEAILSGDIHHPDLPIADQALEIINRIKSDMEELRTDIYEFIRRKSREMSRE